MSWSPLLYLVPLLLIFEIAQLVLGERYLGIRQIEREADPRETGPSEPVAFLWTAGIVLTWLWSIAMLFGSFGRAQALCMLAVSIIGYALRRGCGLKWVLVILTFEGALRVGMLLSLIGLVWRRL